MANLTNLWTIAAVLSCAVTATGDEMPATWETSRRPDGTIVHTVSSGYQSRVTDVVVLQPEEIEADRRYAVLLILPVEAGHEQKWGDPLAEIRRHDLHNRHQLVCVLPTFADLPWYADHPTDPSLRQESYLLDVVLPLIQREYPHARDDAGGRLLVGFSKSGWGAWSLLLRHPDTFGRAAAWDAPLTMDWPSQYGSQPIFSTAENFAGYHVPTLLRTSGSQLGDQPRLIHLGYDSFRDHHQAIESQLQRLAVPHLYRDGPQRTHHWNSGWLSEAVDLLVDAGATAADEAADDERDWQHIAPYFTPPPDAADGAGRYRSPLLFSDGTPVRTADDWQRRREELLADWTNLLGKWPPLLEDQQLEVLETTRRENFTQHRVRFRWTPDETTTGYLLVPDGDGPFPAVITVFYEPETAIGLGRPDRDFALRLTRRGFVTLSIGTTQATADETYSLYYPSLDDAEVQPLSMLGCAAANAWHVLANRPEVDPQRIGIVGHSFGGKWAMFASCLFDKFACAAWSDGGIVFDEQRSSVNYWEPWYLGYHPKPWRKRGIITPDNPARGLYPRLVAAGRNLHELHALMAPRPFLVSGGSEDRPQRWAALHHTVAVNELLGHQQRVGMTNRPDHDPNEESNAVIDAFFEHVLKP